MPGTSSTNSSVWSTNGGNQQVDDERDGADAAEQREQGADRARHAVALEPRGRRRQRDRNDHRDQDRQQQRYELAETAARRGAGPPPAGPPGRRPAVRCPSLSPFISALRYPAGRHRRGSRPVPPPACGLSLCSGAPLEVRDVLGLLVGALLRLGELLLLLALALLAPALLTQARVARSGRRRPSCPGP